MSEQQLQACVATLTWAPVDKTAEAKARFVARFALEASEREQVSELLASSHVRKRARERQARRFRDHVAGVFRASLRLVGEELLFRRIFVARFEHDTGPVSDERISAAFSEYVRENFDVLRAELGVPLILPSLLEYERRRRALATSLEPPFDLVQAPFDVAAIALRLLAGRELECGHDSARELPYYYLLAREPLRRKRIRVFAIGVEAFDYLRAHPTAPSGELPASLAGLGTIGIWGPGAQSVE